MASPILIVDDDEDILVLYKLILEEAGYSVETANCGKDAIEKAKKYKYNLALLDFILPDIKGTEIATTLCSEKRISKVLFITGYSHIFKFIDPDFEDRCRVLLKPVSGEFLVQSVKEMLEQVEMNGADEEPVEEANQVITEKWWSTFRAPE